jgi:hypothetical protein
MFFLQLVSFHYTFLLLFVLIFLAFCVVLSDEGGFEVFDPYKWWILDTPPPQKKYGGFSLAPVRNNLLFMILPTPTRLLLEQMPL